MASWGEKSLLGPVIGSVGEDSILHVTAEETLLGEGNGVLERVVSPAVHPAEEQGTVSLLGNVLVKVELEEFLWAASVFHFIQ